MDVKKRKRKRKGGKEEEGETAKKAREAPSPSSPPIHPFNPLRPSTSSSTSSFLLLHLLHRLAYDEVSATTSEDWSTSTAVPQQCWLSVQSTEVAYTFGMEEARRQVAPPLRVW